MSVDDWSMRVRLNEEALKMVSNLTQGEYFPTCNAGGTEENLSAAQRPAHLG
jgi:hypothetical protein